MVVCIDGLRLFLYVEAGKKHYVEVHTLAEICSYKRELETICQIYQ